MTVRETSPEAKLRERADTLQKRALSEGEAADKLRRDLDARGIDLLKDADAFARLDAAYSKRDATVKLVNELREQYVNMVEEKLDVTGPGAAYRRGATDPASRFARSDALVALRESGILTRDERVQTPYVEVVAREDVPAFLRTRATLTAVDGSGGGLVFGDERPDRLITLPQRRPRVLDLVTMLTTDSDRVEVPVETTHTPGVAETPFGTALPGSEYGFSDNAVPVKRVGHYVAAHKGVLNDSAYLERIVRAYLIEDYQRLVEARIVAGDGQAGAFLGVYNTPDLPTVDATGVPRADAVEDAITKVRIALDAEPTAIGMHPNDWRAYVNEKRAEGAATSTDYAYGDRTDPAAQEPRTLRGLVPVVSPIFVERAPLVGKFDEVEVFVREGVSVAASDAHADFFLRGMVALKAEGRMAMHVRRVGGFVKVENWTSA